MKPNFYKRPMGIPSKPPGSLRQGLLDSILPMTLTLSLSLLFPSVDARTNNEVARPSPPDLKFPKSNLNPSYKEAQDCSHTFLLQGPVRGMIYKRCELPCDKDSENQYTECRKLEAKKQELALQYNQRLGSEATTYSESFIEERRRIQNLKAELDAQDKELDAQNCRNREKTTNPDSSTKCPDLIANWNNLVLSTNQKFEDYNAKVKDLNSILHPRTLELSNNVNQAGEELKKCKDQSISKEALCQKESEKNIQSIEIHQGFDKPERGTPDRVFEFELDTKSPKEEQKSHLLVMDAPDEKPSNSQFSLLMFFPRIQKTKIEVAPDKSISAILPNGEKISFSADKHIPSEGVLIQTRPVERNKPIPPGLKYTGKGYMLRADWKSDGFVNEKKVRLEGQGNNCDLTKYSRLIWNEDMEFQFKTDEQWRKFIQKNCGFSFL